jgi:hypothetical protein
MNCDWTLERLVDYIEGELPSSEVSELAVHLESCRSCRNESLMLKGAKDALREGDVESPSEKYFEGLSSTIMSKIEEISATSVEKEEKAGFNLRTLWDSLFERPAYSLSMAAAGAAIVLLVVYVTPLSLMVNQGEQDLPVMSLSDSYLEKIEASGPPSGLVTYDDAELEYASNYLQYLEAGEIENFFKEVEEDMTREAPSDIGAASGQTVPK